VTRFTGTPENKAALVTGVLLGSRGLSEELANAIVFIALDEALFVRVPAPITKFGDRLSNQTK
jgi:hypothetical protein